MDDRPLDLSALDPARDPGRWAEVMERTLTRAGAALVARRPHPLVFIAEWRRPVLALAAATMLLLVPAEVALERRDAQDERLRALARVSTTWAQEGRTPSGEELLRAMLSGGAP
jgi:hypothetical protein